MSAEALGRDSIDHNHFCFFVHPPPWDFSGGSRNGRRIQYSPAQSSEIFCPDTLQVVNGSFDILLKPVGTGLAKLEKLGENGSSYSPVVPVSIAVSRSGVIRHGPIVFLGE